MLFLLNKIYRVLKVSIIGSGFSSLAAASFLAKQGCDVTVFEKNESIGGRASQFKKEGFCFDMGPTWYWMPDVFEKFFASFGKQVSDYYHLEKLSPAYQVYFGKDDSITIGDHLESIVQTFEHYESGSGNKLRKFIKNAQENYDIAIKDLVYQPGDSIFELITLQTAQRLHQFASTISKDVRKLFKHPYLIQILEFPVLFLGAKPSNTPAFYNFMNYADFGLGTFHPKGGMYSVVKGMETLAKELGVQFKTHAEITKIVVKDNKAFGIECNGEFIPSDVVLSGADYHHTETLLDEAYRIYSESYWKKRTFAPSSLLFYVGFNKKLSNVEHHTLFFDVPFDQHAIEIYDEPQWPTKPLFYASFPSKTDDTFAPEGKEAGVFLIPLAPDLQDTPELREKYFDIILNRLENLTNQSLKDAVIFKESFCVNDFKERYHSYKGNAYGLANTLLQTHILRPKLQSRKVKNLFFTGQLTVPGPGVPPALISGDIVSKKIINQYCYEKSV